MRLEIVSNETSVRTQNRTPMGSIIQATLKNSLLYIFSFSTRSSIQLLEAGYNLPYQSSSTSYYSVCMILISSNVVNERQNKFYSGLYQHHIRYKRKRRSDELVPHLAGLYPISKVPNCLPHQAGVRLRKELDKVIPNYSCSD